MKYIINGPLLIAPILITIAEFIFGVTNLKLLFKYIIYCACIAGRSDIKNIIDTFMNKYSTFELDNHILDLSNFDVLYSDIVFLIITHLISKKMSVIGVNLNYIDYNRYNICIYLPFILNISEIKIISIKEIPERFTTCATKIFNTYKFNEKVGVWIRKKTYDENQITKLLHIMHTKT